MGSFYMGSENEITISKECLHPPFLWLLVVLSNFPLFPSCSLSTSTFLLWNFVHSLCLFLHSVDGFDGFFFMICRNFWGGFYDYGHINLYTPNSLPLKCFNCFLLNGYGCGCEFYFIKFVHTFILKKATLS